MKGFWNAIFRRKAKPSQPTLRRIWNFRDEDIVGYSLYGEDSDTFMYDSVKDDPGLCPVCHNRVKFIVPARTERIKKRVPLQSTYDGFYVVSENFKEFCQSNGYEGVTFTPLGGQPYYVINVENVLYFDSTYYDISGPKQICCGDYYSLCGPEPFMLLEGQHVPDDFIARTDRMFATGRERHPIIIIGLKTREKLEARGFKHLYYMNVYNKILRPEIVVVKQ